MSKMRTILLVIRTNLMMMMMTTTLKKNGFPCRRRSASLMETLFECPSLLFFFKSCLQALLAICAVCSSTCLVAINNIRGSLAMFKTTCRHGHIKEWYSQPMSGCMALSNLLGGGASAILFSGCSSVKAINMLKSVNIMTFSKRTFRHIQNAYLLPTVNLMRERQQSSLLEVVQGKQLTVGGDARCCSPGHTAKYGSYTVMNLKDSQILDTQLVQVTEVKNSHAMELEGLKRCLALLQRKGVTMKNIVTDRHSQIKKFLRETHKDLCHWFDVWHVAKGIKNQLLALSKKAGCEAVFKKVAVHHQSHLLVSSIKQREQ
ncbi:uncharacterized protein LOC133488553 [Phyllopteryx taeniolatus]|uniref:uncharacterized protein LOC133488553 n=1 Tax=Phyllopteryx taeniolatus TaxID=161469 RepID=UPI002AD58B6E|nr:uncharacterized protein LOC133488553 [Phyllopteryx taeniolatus]